MASIEPTILELRVEPGGVTEAQLRLRDGSSAYLRLPDGIFNTLTVPEMAAMVEGRLAAASARTQQAP